jgi:hypothetical protein
MPDQHKVRLDPVAKWYPRPPDAREVTLQMGSA